MSQTREKDQFLKFLRSRGQRVTSERLALFEEVFAQHQHIDAEALLEVMQARGLKISRATVYRNLDLLVESGLARKQRLGRRHFLYEHVHGGQQHDHLVCTRCGRVLEFSNEQLERMLPIIADEHQFQVQRHRVEIYGVCHACQQL